jgi:hypothetical protein
MNNLLNSAQSELQDEELQIIQRSEAELEQRKAEYRKSHGLPDDYVFPPPGMTKSFGGKPQK